MGNLGTLLFISGLILLSLVIAFLVRAAWAYSLPGLLLLLLLFWLLFGV